MPGIVKVGMTNRDPAARARELSAHTGVPTSFEVVRSVRVSDRFAAEREAHARLARHRVSHRREFFRVSEAEAVRALLATSAGRRACDIGLPSRIGLAVTAAVLAHHFAGPLFVPLPVPIVETAAFLGALAATGRPVSWRPRARRRR